MHGAQDGKSFRVVARFSVVDADFKLGYTLDECMI